MTYALEARGFTITYPNAGQPVFPPLDLMVEPGETVALRGESGAGKSSFLYAVCGLLPGGIPAQTGGELRLFGKNPAQCARAELTRHVGMVFQNPETQLFCGTVALEVAFGLENCCVEPDSMRRRVREALELAGLWERRACAPSQLSGGQKQLLALAAVLALRPKLLLLDEAFSQLDSESAARLFEALRELQSQGQTILFADHDDARCAPYRNIWIGGAAP
ncbi:MAG: energy-coupling factor ABC transporter ATP-binding protein [Oscillospiraceae bacterium]|jgi:energy-coupling factor transporter ATP-binding protein EcfA2|nr:energy-coupling factor ABC transporter ATP-binding protein [Oscillospiraceae bacterium]